jgi:hypothetical protein
MTSYLPNSFSIHTPASIPVNMTKLRPELPNLVVRQDAGGVTGTVINPQLLGSHAIFVTPSQTSTLFLPAASKILQMFGYSVDTGIPKLQVGDVLQLKVVNRGTGTAIIQGDALSSDSSAVFVPATGTNVGISLVGFPKDLFIEFLQVSGSPQGMTGLYTVY